MTTEELEALPVTFGLETAARAIGMGRNQAYALAGDEKFPVRVRKVNGRYRVTRFDLMAWLGAPGYPEPAQEPAGPIPVKARRADDTGSPIAGKCGKW